MIPASWRALWVAVPLFQPNTLLVPVPLVQPHEIAQSSPVASIQCFPDTTGRSRPERVTLGLGPGPLSAAPDSNSEQDLLIAEAIRAHFQKPTALSLPLWAWFDSPGDTVRYSGTPAMRAGLASDLRFQLGRDGRLVDDIVTIETASPELNASLAAAVRSADASGAFSRIERDPRARRRPVVLHLMNYEDPDGPAVALIRLIIPQIKTDSGVRVISIPRPQYPQLAHIAGLSSFVDLQYVVTPEGRADRNSFRVIKAEYLDFVAAAMNALLRGKFVPAMLRGCAVPMLVQQRISFGMRR